MRISVFEDLDLKKTFSIIESPKSSIDLKTDKGPKVEPDHQKDLKSFQDSLSRFELLSDSLFD